MTVRLRDDGIVEVRMMQRLELHYAGRRGRGERGRGERGLDENSLASLALEYCTQCRLLAVLADAVFTTLGEIPPEIMCR